MNERIGIKRREETIVNLTDAMIEESNRGLAYLKEGKIVEAMFAHARATDNANMIQKLKAEIKQIQDQDRRVREQEFLSDIHKDLGIDGIEIRFKF